jgi:hypothetical protein
MSEAQRDAILSGHQGACIAHAHDLARAYDETGERPEIQWCETHKSPVVRFTHPDAWMHLEQQTEYGIYKCRVVSAIVVVPPGDAA